MMNNVFNSNKGADQTCVCIDDILLKYFPEKRKNLRDQNADPYTLGKETAKEAIKHVKKFKVA